MTFRRLGFGSHSVETGIQPNLGSNNRGLRRTLRIHLVNKDIFMQVRLYY